MKKSFKQNGKSKILESLSKGESVKSAAKKYGATESTICGIKKKRHKIIKKNSKFFADTGKTQTTKISTYLKMEKSVI